MTFMQDATSLIYFMEKIEKWLTVKDDPQYARLWVLYSASTYANMRLLLDGRSYTGRFLSGVLCNKPV